MWIAPVILIILVIILTIGLGVSKTVDSKMVLGTLLIILCGAAFCIYSFVVLPAEYKAGQIDALNGEIKYEFMPDTTKDNSFNWEEIKEE